MRFLFYSHDGLGLGHTRRHLAVAAALARTDPAAVILLATGAEDLLRLGLPRQVEILKLPGLRKDANNKYSSRRMRVSVEEIRGLRSALLLTTVKQFRPDVVLVDKHPFGASGEFKAGLKAQRQQGGLAVLGLRDILDEPAVVMREWRRYRMQQRIVDFYDHVLVYGDQAVFDPVAAYGFPPSLAERTHFCGYVFARQPARALENFDWPFPPPEHRSRPVVLATVGGGEDGFRTLENFMRASERQDWQAMAIAGPMAPDSEWERLQALADQTGVTLRRYVPHLAALFGRLDVLVCMGGYNTLIEAVAEGVPTVCIPRISPRREQLIRSEAFARLGLVQSSLPGVDGPEALRFKIRTALALSRPQLQRRARHLLNFNGAERASDYLVEVGRLAKPNLLAGSPHS